MKATTNIDTKAGFDTNGNPAAAEQGQTKGKTESDLRAAARPQPEGAGGPDGRQLRLPVLGGQWSAALDSHVAGEGHGGPGSGARHCCRLPLGWRGRGEMREQLHPRAGPGGGPEHGGTGRLGGRVIWVHDPGIPGPEEHEPKSPKAGGSRAGCSRQGSGRPASHGGSSGLVGANGCPRVQPE